MSILNKLSVMLVVFANIIFSMVPSCHSNSNLALGKHYTLSQVPNYSLSAQPSDTSSLTDGKYSIGYFWTQRSTVGWQGVKTVEILIDLEKESNIGSITFNTARGKEAEVYYPAHIAAFVGPDRGHLKYVGDLADDPENQPGSYLTKKFTLNNVDIRGRYVLLEAIPKGAFLFCDEIEVIEGTSGQRKTGNLTIEKAREFANQLIRLDREKPLLNKMAENLAALVDKQTGVTRLHEIKQQIKGLQPASNVDVIETELLALRGTALTKIIPSKTLHVQTFNPWAPLNPVSPVSITTGTSLSLVVPKDGYDSGAVLITNVSTSPLQVSTALDKIPGGADLFLYQVPFIKTAALEQVADPLIPATGNFNLRPGESRMLFVTAFGKQSGNWKTALHIKSAGKVTTLPISIQVASVQLPKHLSLNSVNWGYLDFKLIRDRQQAAVADLLAHHTNVVVVPPAYLPITDLLSPLDLSGLEKYLNTSKRASKVLLFANFASALRSSVNGKHTFMGNDWKKWFKSWYGELTKTAAKAGISSDNLYFYPYDEMDGKQIDEFIAFASWARKELPGIRLYATLDNKKALSALPYLDVAQIANLEELLGGIGTTKSEIWIYDAKGPAKALSPYSYYRLMAWKAFFYGYKGIGFWAYADAGSGDNPGTAWDDFDGKNPDYAVIYEGEGNSIISSRRWEAWRIGIEDYELLTMYAKAKGDAAAKALAKSVLDNPLDTAKADEVRRKILLDLSK